MEDNDLLGFDSFENENSEIGKKALQYKTHGEIMSLNKTDPKMVDKSIPLILSPTKVADNTDISDFDPVHGGFDMSFYSSWDNSPDGLPNSNHKNVTP